MIDPNGSGRELALSVLTSSAREKSYIDVALKRALDASSLDPREKALASRLCYGLVQNRALLDYYIQPLSSVKLKRMHPVVLDILRLGFYQLTFMDRIPASAAVNTSVELAKKSGNIRAAGLINAIMRRASSESFCPPDGDSIAELSIRFSHPEWLSALFVETLGAEGAAALLEANNEQPSMCVRLNRLKGGMDGLTAALSAAGVEYERHPVLDDCLLLSHTGDIEALPAFSNGLFAVQDAASQICVLAAGAKPGENVLDACAAPGGKSFYLADIMQNDGTITSCDIYEHKLERIKSGAVRLGVSNIDARLWDAGEYNPEWENKFDFVLADLPCSGLGIIRKKPDIRYKAQDDIKQLPDLQKRLLGNLLRYVKPGGRLIYSTCTLNSDENQGVVSHFLEKHDDFSAGDFEISPEIKSEGGMLTLWPHLHRTDGFFICKMVKKST